MEINWATHLDIDLWSSNGVLEWTKEKKNHLLVAECNGNIVGFAHLGLKETKGQNTIILEGEIVPTSSYMGQSRLTVLPEYRRMGVATALIKQTEELFKSKDADFMVAHTYFSNIPSCLLFKKLGFQNKRFYWYKPYSTLVPLFADGVYAELDLNKPIKKPKLNPHTSVRKASISDIEALVRIFDRPWGATTPERVKNWLRKTEMALVAEYKGEVVGAMGWFRDGGLGIYGVLPEYRRRGIGSTLFYHLLTEMKKSHTKATAYSSILFTDALKMYWRFGFTEKERNTCFFKTF